MKTDTSVLSTWRWILFFFMRQGAFFSPHINRKIVVIKDFLNAYDAAENCSILGGQAAVFPTDAVFQYFRNKLLEELGWSLVF